MDEAFRVVRLFPAEQGRLLATHRESLLDMLKRYALSFYQVVQDLEKMRVLTGLRTTSYVSPSELASFALEELEELLSRIRAECDTLGLVHTSEQVSFVESRLRPKHDKYNYNNLKDDLDHLSHSFGSELQRTSLFRIPDDKATYFQNDDLFGSEVPLAFPSCSTEITSAGNCYALEQYDACVYHLMRILGIGLKALADKFSVDFKHENWGNVIDGVAAKVKGIDSKCGSDWKDQRRLYSEAALHFRFLKDAWRNHIMHEPENYDAGQALSMLDHIRDFMRALAAVGLKE